MSKWETAARVDVHWAWLAVHVFRFVDVRGLMMVWAPSTSLLLRGAKSPKNSQALGPLLR